MATQVQIRRGTSSQVAAFTGAEGEIVVNTTNDSVHVNDGSTAGGFEMARADLNNVSDTDLNAALTGNTVSALTVTSLTSSGIDVTGTADVSSQVLVGGNDTIIAENNIRFKSGGGAFIDHNTTGQSITFRTSNASSLDTTAVTIGSSGAVGVGVSNPSSYAANADNLVIGGEANVGMHFDSNSSSGNGGIYFSDQAAVKGILAYSHTDDAMQFFTNGTTERFRIDSSGNVTVKSAGELRIRDDGSFIKEDQGLQIGNTSGTGTTRPIRFLTESAERMRIDSSGNVDITTGNLFTDATSGIFFSGGIGNFSNGIYGVGVNNVAINANGSERMRIDSSGKLLLATTNTGGTFSVERNGNTYNINAVSDANNTSEGFFRGYSTSAGADRVIIYSNGNIVNAGNSYGALSDLKLKENIVDSGSQWDDLKAVKVRKYSMKLDQVAEANQLGVIAQELESSGMTNLVYESIDRDIDGNDLGTTTKQVKYSILYMKAVKALQEAMDRIETLEIKVQQLENN